MRLVGVATGKLLEKVDGGLFRPGMLTGAFCFFEVGCGVEMSAIGNNENYVNNYE